MRKLALAAALGLAACGGESPKSAEQKLCARLDTCQLLAAGDTAKDCTDRYTATLATFTPAERSDWEGVVNSCLALADCPGFQACYCGTFPASCP